MARVGAERKLPKVVLKDDVPPKQRRRQSTPVRPFSFDDIASQWMRERPDLDLDSMLLNIAITRLYRFFYGHFEMECQRRWGIDHAESRLLLSLRRSGRPFAARPTDLFRSLLVTSGAITKQVNRLVSKGLVERGPDPLHAGGFLVHLTPKGLKVSNAVAEYLVQSSLISKAMTVLTEEERAQMLARLKRLLAAVEIDSEESFPASW